MAYVFSRAEKLVAIMITLSVIIAIAAAILIGANKGFFQFKNTYQTEFKSAKGLKTGMTITLQDVIIGKIKKMRLNKENLIDVEVEIFREYTDRVREDSVLVLKGGGLLGSPSLVLYPGSPESKKLENNSFLQSSGTALGVLLRRKHELTMKGNSIDAVLADVSDLAGKLSDEEGDFQGLIKNLYTLSRLVQSSADPSFKRPKDAPIGDGNLAYILFDPIFREEIKLSFERVSNILENARVVSEDLSNTMHYVVTKQKDLDAMITNIETILTNTQEISRDLKETVKKLNNNSLLNIGNRNR